MVRGACRRFQRWKGFERPLLLYEGGMITAFSWPLKTAFYDTFPWWTKLLYSYQYHAINQHKGDDDKSRESRQLSSTAPSLRPINVKLVVKLSGSYDYSIIPWFPHKLTESNSDLNHFQNSVIIPDWTVMSTRYAVAGITLSAQNSHIFHLNYKLISLDHQHNLTIFIIWTLEDNRALIICYTEFDRMRIHSSFAGGCCKDTNQLSNPSEGFLCEPACSRQPQVRSCRRGKQSRINPFMLDTWLYNLLLFVGER